MSESVATGWRALAQHLVGLSPSIAALGMAVEDDRDAPQDHRDARRRALGQNFLHDQSVVDDIISTLHPPPGREQVDLGAGAGAPDRRSPLAAHV